MPTVPTQDSLRVREEALPNARVNTNAPIEAFGGGAAAAGATRAVQGMGDQVFKMAQAEKQKADDLAVKEGYMKLVQAKQRLIYDPKSGAMTRKGKDSFGILDEYGQSFDKEADGIEESFASEDQRAMFKEIRMRERVELDGHLQRHTFGETQRFAEETTEAGIKTQQDEAILNYMDPQKRQSAINMQKALIMSHAADNGKSPEWVKLKLDDAVSKTHSSVMDRMLANGDDMLASKYYAENKGSMTGTDAIAMEKVLEEGSLRGESQRQTDAIMRTGADMTSALRRAREIEDPKLRDAVTDRIKSEFSLQEAADRDRRENLHKAAGNIIDKSGSVDDIPPNQWAQFSVSEKASLKAYAKARREGTDPETDLQLYYEMKTLASHPATRQKFLQMNLYEHVNKFAKTEFKEMVTLQTSLRSGDDKAAKALDGFRTDQSIVNDALSAAGVKMGDKANEADKNRVAKFRRLVDEQVIKLQEVSGKKATNDDVQRIVDNLMVKGTVPGSGFNILGFKFGQSEKRAYELQTGDEFELTVENIPKGERSKIEAALKSRGIEVSDQKILQLYGRKLGGMARGN